MSFIQSLKKTAATSLVSVELGEEQARLKLFINNMYIIAMDLRRLVKRYQSHSAS